MRLSSANGAIKVHHLIDTIVNSLVKREFTLLFFVSVFKHFEFVRVPSERIKLQLFCPATALQKKM